MGSTIIMEVDMKTNIYSLIAITTYFLFLTACSTTEHGKKGLLDSRSKYAVETKNLGDHLNSIPRLTVVGNKIYNNSVASFETDTAPLFVIDDIQVGRSLEDVLRLLDSNRVVIVEFIKMSPATVRFGEAGRNGAILISRTM